LKPFDKSVHTIFKLGMVAPGFIVFRRWSEPFSEVARAHAAWYTHFQEVSSVSKRLKKEKKREPGAGGANGQSKNGQPGAQLIPGKNVIIPTGGGDPARVSGMFANDPAFEEFRQILREQREDDLRQTIEEMEADRTREATACSSSTPIRSRTRSTATPSSRKK